jgi:hypothetical protein
MYNQGIGELIYMSLHLPEAMEYLKIRRFPKSQIFVIWALLQ